MYLLKPENYSNILTLYDRVPIDFPLIRSVIEKIQDGWIYVDDSQAPNNAIVITKFGFVFLFGDPENEDFNDGINRLLSTDPHTDAVPSYLLWYDPPQYWQDRFLSLSPNIVKARDRQRFAFRPERFGGCRTSMNTLPGEFTVARIDRPFLRGTAQFNLDLTSRFWGSEEDFLNKGLGYCVLANHVPVSICYAACVTRDRVAEIDVATLEQYRGRKLATFATAAFLEHCIRFHIEPSWDCFAYNKASYNLAVTLGFEPDCNYQFYTINRQPGLFSVL